MDPDIVLGISLGSDNTLALGGKQATHISLFLFTFASSVLPLSLHSKELVLCKDLSVLLV